MPPFKLEVAFNEFVSGVFTLNSALDGPDVLTDVGVFAGTFDDISRDVDGQIVVETGTDSLGGQAQAGKMQLTVSRPDDPGYWNANNPNSPLNSVEPGFVEMRPARLTVYAADGTGYPAFFGFLRRAPWRASTRNCQLYFEDMLFRASRVFPVIASTGPTTTGAVINLTLDELGVLDTPEWRIIADGDPLDDFSADGTISVLQIWNNLLEAERGTIFHRLDGPVVYESRDMPRTREPVAWSLNMGVNLADFEAGLNADNRLTRVTVTRTSDDGDVVRSSFSSDAERRFGRADIPAISSPYIPSSPSDAAQLLADDLVYEASSGWSPATADAAGVDDDSLRDILSAPLQSVIPVVDDFGGTDGEFIVQRIRHTIATGPLKTQYTLKKRVAREFTLESALDGPDVFRY